MKFGQLVRVIELGAADAAKYAPAIVTGVVGDLVDVVARIGGAWHDLQALPVATHEQAMNPDAAGEVYPAGKDTIGSTAHIAVPLEGDEPATAAAAEPTPDTSAMPAGLPPTLQAPTSS